MSANHSDVITLDIIKDALHAIGEEMFISVARTSKSPIIYEVLDYASGLTDASGRLLTQGNGATGFLGMLSSIIRDVIEKFTNNGNLFEGDMIIINDPYGGGGSHLCDVGMVLPVFYGGEIIAYCVNKCHWTEVGGKDPGYPVDSTEVYQEGLQFPCIKICEKGVMNEGLVDLIRANVRFPDLSIGDMWAQISGLRTGAKRIRELCDKYSAELVKSSVDRLLKNSAQFSRSRVAALPDGVYEAHGMMDEDGLGNGPFPIRVKITIDGDRMKIDFTGSAKQVPGPINLPYAGLVSGVRSIFLAATDPSQEVNDGVFEPLEIVSEPGCVFSACRPAPVSVYYESMQFAQDLIWQALAPLLPDKLSAGHFLTVGGYVFAGQHPVTGESFINVGPTLGGWGAALGQDGDSAQFCTGDGETFNVPAEIMEACYGVIVEEYSLHADGTGAGKYRGGNGVILAQRVLGENNYFSGTYGRHEVAPWGFAGGKDGSPNGFEAICKDGTRKGPFGKYPRLPLHKGDLLRVVTGTGGGYGDPYERGAEKVRMDVKNGYVTPEQAETDYGVKIDPETLEILGLTEERASRRAQGV